MSFQPPTAYSIESIRAEINDVQHNGQRFVWVKLFFRDANSGREDMMDVHTKLESADKFQRLAALINEAFGENTTQETSSEV